MPRGNKSQATMAEYCQCWYKYHSQLIRRYYSRLVNLKKKKPQKNQSPIAPHRFDLLRYKVIDRKSASRHLTNTSLMNIDAT